MSKDIVSTKESFVQDGSTIVGKDTTVKYSDGSSDTTHQNASLFWGSAYAGAITGVTHNNPDGTSTHKSR